MTTNLELINQYRELQKKVREQIKTEGSNIAKEVFKEVFEKHPGLTYIVIRGYTPEFNDGEPCVHGQEVLFGYKWVGKQESFDFADYDLEEEFCFDLETRTHCNSACNTLNDVSTTLSDLEELLKEIYDTNFELKIRYSQGNVDINYDSYDCGY